MGEERGSAKMWRERYEKGIPSELIDVLPGLGDGDGIEFWDVWIKGQPPRIDELSVSYRVQVGQVGDLINKVFGTYEGIPLRVLIHGQPPRIDRTLVDFQTPGF